MVEPKMIVEAEFKSTTDYLDVYPGDVGQINFWISEPQHNPRMVSIQPAEVGEECGEGKVAD